MDKRIRDKEAEYGKRALEYTSNQLKVQGKGARDQIFPVIEPGTKEWLVWERYFKEYLGFEPLAMRRARTHEQKGMTVPTQYPEWFDSTYTEGKGGHYFPPKRAERSVDGPPKGESFAELFAKHGRPFGPFDVGRQLPYKG